MKFLITGGVGFIGSALIRYMINKSNLEKSVKTMMNSEYRKYLESLI